MRSFRRLVIFAAGLALLAGLVAAAPAIPELRARVTDLAGVLPPGEPERLEKFLADFESQTSNQVAVLVVKSLEGAEVEDYAIRVARGWGLGTKERDNGVLLLVAVEDRKIRIEVGTGLQGSLPDAVASRIIRNEMAPLLPRGSERWSEALWAGVKGITLATKGEYKGEDKGEARPTRTGRKGDSLHGLVVVGLIVLGVLGRLLKAWISAILGAVFGLIFYGPIGLVLGFFAGLLAPLFLSLRGGGFVSGGGGGGGGGWSSGGGGFSGGGGGFDGGGASGDF